MLALGISIALAVSMLAALFLWAACVVAGHADDAADQLPHGDWTRITPEMRAAEADYLAGRDGEW